MNTKIVVSALAALFIGLWIGRALPQADLRGARQEIEKLKSAAKERPASARAAIAGVESMLNVRREDVAEARRVRKARPATERAASAVATGAVAAAQAATPAAPAKAGLSNEIERVRQAWELRREIARKNFLERTELDSRQAADFDVLIEAMNLRLGTTIDRWAERIRTDDAFSAETGVRMMNELSSAVVVTYDELDRKLPAEWRQQAGPKFELVRFVDPEVLTPLQDLDEVISKTQAEAAEAPSTAPEKSPGAGFEFEVEVK